VLSLYTVQRRKKSKAVGESSELVVIKIQRFKRFESLNIFRQKREFVIVEVENYDILLENYLVNVLEFHTSQHKLSVQQKFVH
jgi:hypothetical protein